jgi:hypothetical protein
MLYFEDIHCLVSGNLNAGYLLVDYPSADHKRSHLQLRACDNFQIKNLRKAIILALSLSSINTLPGETNDSLPIHSGNATSFTKPIRCENVCVRKQRPSSRPG